MASNPNTFLRTESPTVSVSSAGQISGQRSPTIPDSASWGPQNASTSTSNLASRPATDAESSSMDAHRQRELKWMSLMSSNPASRARKSKKVKKLLMDGIPSSMFIIQWVHSSLCFFFVEFLPSFWKLSGLTLIVGQLLLLSLEEDAFWIFVLIMDTHVHNDGALARKLLVDMGIQPISICQPWFSMLFVSILPPEYLNRVWDLLLFEGVPFLLRVGLAVIICCRQKLLDSTQKRLLAPSHPDAFLSLTFSVKLKDDDVKKQHVKMEAQVKRQIQVPLLRLPLV
ncbi:hypothetical protein CPB84DRAFT_1816476 [Gymnopilus junonius]|uniref:Rab-GAP TBC domain-containing protein n=1 Tax=Gymnopilus junonius TaxID=109634 RepID=A0A9P5NJM2_GYMJU|nr:hypothetical protein CPB84DRAFT_1816476 [Gymnopilus junonius]